MRRTRGRRNEEGRRARWNGITICSYIPGKTGCEPFQHERGTQNDMSLVSHRDVSLYKVVSQVISVKIELECRWVLWPQLCPGSVSLTCQAWWLWERRVHT